MIPALIECKTYITNAMKFEEKKIICNRFCLLITKSVFLKFM